MFFLVPFTPQLWRRQLFFPKFKFVIPRCRECRGQTCLMCKANFVLVQYNIWVIALLAMLEATVMLNTAGLPPQLSHHTMWWQICALIWVAVNFGHVLHLSSCAWWEIRCSLWHILMTPFNLAEEYHIITSVTTAVGDTDWLISDCYWKADSSTNTAYSLHSAMQLSALNVLSSLSLRQWGNVRFDLLM